MTGAGETHSSGRAGPSSTPAFHVIVLGSGGGPDEDNVTGLLVRSTATAWAKGSVLAVDAGTHLAGIARILRNNLAKGSGVQQEARTSRARTKSGSGKRPTKRLSTDAIAAESSSRGSPSTDVKPSPSCAPTLFEGLELPYETADANAAYITRELVSTYLITHPHLDHISGFVINTASFQHTSRPKRLAALPGTIDAIKTHVFNDVLWPNLSDEDDGVGLVSFMRLAEGGNVALGEGEGRGYIEVCEGLAVRGRSISHGHCMKQHSHRASTDGQMAELTTQASNSQSAMGSTPSNEHGRLRRPCVIDSSAYFIRDDDSGHEVLIFGDVEPDSLSLSPRTARIWAEAAPKISAGMLTGIFIECSYDDSQSDETLFGHLAPRHLIAELKVLAEKVRSGTSSPPDVSASTRKRRPERPAASTSATRRRTSNQRSSRAARSERLSRATSELPGSAVSSPKDSEMVDMTSSSELSPQRRTARTSHPQVGLNFQRFDDAPLKGLQVIIIHAKNALKDGLPAGERILAQLEGYENEANLGCTFILPHVGCSIWL